MSAASRPLVSATFYFDLRCPFCWAASERLQRMENLPPIDFRSVRHERELPIPARPLTESEATFVDKELVVMRERVPELHVERLDLWPSTLPVARAVAAMTRSGRGDVGVFVSTMYRALWQERRDPSSPLVISTALRSAGAGGLIPGPQDDPMLETWLQAWAAREQRTPTFVSSSGVALVGLATERRLEAFLRSGRIADTSEDAC